MQKKNKTPIKLFVVAFAVIAALAVYQHLSRQKMVMLLVKDNKGTTLLETAAASLVCVFQDGKVCLWDWADLDAPPKEFQAASDRAVVLGSSQLAAVSTTGKKILTVYALPDGRKQKELSVGWEDQDVWPRLSWDKKTLAVIRKSPADSSGRLLYEFLTLDLDREILGLPASLSIDDRTEALVEWAVDSRRILYASGCRAKQGRIVAVNLETGSVLWDRVYENTAEICSLLASPDGRYLLAGDRKGQLLKISAAGEIEKTIPLLQPGETRPITNDYSVLNLAFSPDGKYYAATINPKVYLLSEGADSLVHSNAPADKLVSKIAFSPDHQRFATSDIRAGYPVKIFNLPPPKESPDL